jgi:hypothetical protein
VLVDPDLDARFAEDGYAVVPMLDQDEVEALRAGHAEIGPALASDGGMAFDYMQDARRAMEQITELLAPVWGRRLPEVFADHRVIFSTFVLKRPTEASGMYLHDDRSFVDERRHRSYALWVALDDTSPEIGNGCLHLVPGSHRIASAASGSNTPDWFTPYRGYFRRFLVPVPAKAGEAVVYDSKTLHCSPPNRTSHVRRAIASAIAPADAPLRWTFAEGDRRRVFAIDEQFFVDHHPHEVEREGMPAGYALVDEYVERNPTPDPRAIAAVCDPTDVPSPEADPPHLFPDESPPKPPPAEAPAAGGREHEPHRARVVASRMKRRLLRR